MYFDIWSLFFYLNRDIFPISIQGVFSSALSHDTPYIPTLTSHNQRNRSPTSNSHAIHLQSLIISPYPTTSSLYPITAIARATRSPLSSYMLIYNIIYLSTILYPISYLTSYTRAIISKRKPTARPDTLYRYTYYLFIHIKTSTRHQIRYGNSWR